MKTDVESFAEPYIPGQVLLFNDTILRNLT